MFGDVKGALAKHRLAVVIHRYVIVDIKRQRNQPGRRRQRAIDRHKHVIRAVFLEVVGAQHVLQALVETPAGQLHFLAELLVVVIGVGGLGDFDRGIIRVAVKFALSIPV